MACFTYKRHLLQSNYPQLTTMKVGASQTIVVGNLIMVTAGYAVKATAGNVSGNLVGIATEDVTTTNAGDDDLKVLLIDRWTVMFAKVSGTDAVQANLLTTKYDIEDTNHTVNFNDSDGGFLIPMIIPDSVVNGFGDFVANASSLWNA